MQENREKWMELCEQAATEQDPEKLMELISQITDCWKPRSDDLKAIPLPLSRRANSAAHVILSSIRSNLLVAHEHPTPCSFARTTPFLAMIWQGFRPS